MTAAVWLAAVALAVAVGVRIAGSLGVEDSWVTTPLLGAFPWVVALAVLAAAAAGLVAIRRPRLRRPTVVLVALAVVGVGIVVPRTVARTQPDAAGALVTVGVLNARIGGADAQRVAELVETTGVSLLAVVELTRASDEALRAAGVATSLPTIAVEDVPTPSGGVYAVGQLRPQRDGPPAGGTPDVVWTTPDGDEIVVTTVHATAPIGRAATERWQRGVARTPAPPGGDGLPAVVLGDFNATVDHATFRGLLGTGWRDAALEAGRGLGVTYDGLLDRSPALPMGIDHVLVSPGIAVEAVRTYDVPGTDHRLLVADLLLP